MRTFQPLKQQMNRHLMKKSNAIGNPSFAPVVISALLFAQKEKKKIPKLTNLTQNGSFAPLNLLVWPKT